MTKRVIAVVAVCMGLSALFAAPASAHDKTIQHGDAIAWVSNGHTVINVYDQSCFGNYGSWTEFYYTTIGGSILDSVATPCGTTRTKSTYPQRITSFRASPRSAGAAPGQRPDLGVAGMFGCLSGAGGAPA